MIRSQTLYALKDSVGCEQDRRYFVFLLERENFKILLNKDHFGLYFNHFFTKNTHWRVCSSRSSISRYDLIATAVAGIKINLLSTSWFLVFRIKRTERLAVIQVLHPTTNSVGRAWLHPFPLVVCPLPLTSVIDPVYLIFQPPHHTN